MKTSLLCLAAIGLTMATAKEIPSFEYPKQLKAPNFIKASDPRVWIGGRTSLNADGSSLDFDWEGVAFYMNVQSTSYVQVLMNTTGPMSRLYTQLSYDGGKNWFDQTSQWISPRSGQNIYWAADNLNSAVNYTVRITSDLEPAFSGASGGGYFTFIGFNIDGTATAATPQTRRIEIVGDSISAGYGARGSAAAPGCPVMDWTSGVTATYMHQVCDYFNALCSWVAWSGKGMYQNCCDNGETMPSYYLQTRGGQAYEQNWDFSFVPDAIFINLGTNDFGHENGPAWIANFTNTYVQFVLNATQIHYKNPKMPVFLGQGDMNNGNDLHDALQAAATAINAAGGNAVYVDMRVPNGTEGCVGHPGKFGHAQMAAMAEPIIASTMGWN